MSSPMCQALENIHRERLGRGSTASQYDEAIVPPVMKRSIAVYEAARVLIGYITPRYDEISQARRPHVTPGKARFALSTCCALLIRGSCCRHPLIPRPNKSSGWAGGMTP